MMFTINAVYFPNSIDQVIFVIKTKRVFCKVGTEIANIYMNFRLNRVKTRLDRHTSRSLASS